MSLFDYDESIQTPRISEIIYNAKLNYHWIRPDPNEHKNKSDILNDVNGCRFCTGCNKTDCFDSRHCKDCVSCISCVGCNNCTRCAFVFNSENCYECIRISEKKNRAFYNGVPVLPSQEKWNSYYGTRHELLNEIINEMEEEYKQILSPFGLKSEDFVDCPSDCCDKIEWSYLQRQKFVSRYQEYCTAEREKAGCEEFSVCCTEKKTTNQQESYEKLIMFTCFAGKERSQSHESERREVLDERVRSDFNALNESERGKLLKEALDSRQNEILLQTWWSNGSYPKDYLEQLVVRREKETSSIQTLSELDAEREKETSERLVADTQTVRSKLEAE